MIDNEWSFNELGSDTWCHGTYETEKEAEEAALEYAKENGLKVMRIGRCEGIPLPECIGADEILELLEQQYADKAGEWYYDEYLYEGVSKEDKEWLEEELSKVVRAFHEKAGVKSPWGTVSYQISERIWREHENRRIDTKLV